MRWMFLAVVSISVCARAQTQREPGPLVELQWHEAAGASSSADNCAVVFANHTYHVRWSQPASENRAHFGIGHLDNAQAKTIDRLLKPGVFETLPFNDYTPLIPETRSEWLAVRLDRRGLSWRKSGVWLGRGDKTQFPPELLTLRVLLDSMVTKATMSKDLLPDVCPARLQLVTTVVSRH